MTARIDWSQHDALLGTDFDDIVAARIGCTRGVVLRRRNLLGIPRFGGARKKPDVADRGLLEIVQRLGVSNAEIVRRWRDLGGLSWDGGERGG